MAVLRHEIWQRPTEDGRWLPSLCLAGPDGEGARRLMEAGSKCVQTFTAGSHFEAMTIYHHFLGFGPYVTTHDADYLPYPQDWALRQQK
jgi:hypothetical protein